MKIALISIIMVVVLTGAAILVTKTNSQNQASTQVVASNVTVKEGKQIITINAKGGYQPQKSIAKAGIPTIIQFDTNGTFDCSSSVRIPSMNISKVLPQTGSTDIDIGTQQAGTLQGTCGMGMYDFTVEFTS